jgi:hypothetical protein
MLTAPQEHSCPQVQGNNKLKVGLQAKNKQLLRDAVEFYTKGLAERCGDGKLDAVLLCNRAHVESLLGACQYQYQYQMSTAHVSGARGI